MKSINILTSDEISSRIAFSKRRERFPLSQRERAGVREKLPRSVWRYLPFLALAALLCFTSAASAKPKPPKGFIALFNGKDLEGFRGGETFAPAKLAAMTPEKRDKQLADWNRTMREHWSVENEELVNDGKGAYATTEKEFGDFELRLEYKTVARADSGIYLRGIPQVQIWDYTDPAKFARGADKGSGGLWNNSTNNPGKNPKVLADKPFGEWNTFRIIMCGERVSVWLNKKLVVDHAVLENFYDRTKPVPAKGPIQLQTHGGEIRWRNIFLREIGEKESKKFIAEAKNK